MSDARSASRRRKLVRHATRLIAFLLALAAALSWTPWPEAERWAVAVSPFIAIGAAIASRAFAWTMLAAGVVPAVCAVRPRFFCRYVCPMGLMLDVVGRLPLGRSIVRRTPRVGMILAVMTWGLAVVGLPVFLWLDPLAMFSALFGHGAHPWMAIVPACVLVMTFFLPKLWCMKLCPLGATQDLVRIPTAMVRERPREEAAPADDETPPLRASRRGWLLGVAGSLGAVGCAAYVGERWARLHHDDAPRLRPPGMDSLSDQRFLCVRCGACMSVCPEAIVRPDAAPRTLLDVGLPIVAIDVDGGHCREDCRRCVEVCPSGAIASLTLEEKNNWPIGLARGEMDLCVLLYNKECEICRRACPRDAITFPWSDELYTAVPTIDASRCNGCGACVAPCPGTNYWEVEADPATPVRKAISIAEPRGGTGARAPI